MMALLKFFVGPIGRYVALALVIAGGALWTINHFESRGAAKERARIDEVNRNAEDKADAARAASERGSDSGGLPDDDGWRRD